MTEITDYFSKIGKVGGSKTSEKKKESGRKNAEKARIAKANKKECSPFQCEWCKDCDKCCQQEPCKDRQKFNQENL